MRFFFSVYEPMLNIFNMFKSIVVIILIEVQIVLSFAIGSFFMLSPDPFYFFFSKKKKHKI